MPGRPLGFHANREPDGRGRYLMDILAWPDSLLEQVHDYIQWLFPLPEPSPVNPGAPVLDAATIEEFRASPLLQANLRTALRRMIRFYGLEIAPDGGVAPGAEFEGRAADWLWPGNHNHLRLTRILRSCAILGLEREAQALREQLLLIAAARPDRVTARTVTYWTEATEAAH